MSLQKADLNVQNGDLSAVRDMEKYKSLLTKLDREEIRGRHVRCRTEWLEYGETSQKFSASTEKRQAGKHQFCQLKTDIGMAKTQNQLLSTVSNFYGELYQQETPCSNVRRHFVSKMDTVLNDNDQVSCEGPLSLDELTISLRQLKTGKAPELDGLPVEFCRAFWDCLKDDLVQIVNEVNISGSLSSSQRTGVITLLLQGCMEIARAS